MGFPQGFSPTDRDVRVGLDQNLQQPTQTHPPTEPKLTNINDITNTMYT